MQTYTQCTILHTGSSGPLPLVLNTMCSSIQPIYSWRWAHRCLKHVELFMIINKIVASSWYLSSFSYMMHGHTYIKFVSVFLALCNTSCILRPYYIIVPNRAQSQIREMKPKEQGGGGGWSTNIRIYPQMPSFQ
jgi:CHASE2 domain-containing sensor protein